MNLIVALFFQIILEILSQIIMKIKGMSCQRLYHQSKNELKITGASFGIGDHNFSIGEFSNKIKKLHDVNNIAISLDDTQYLLCNTISTLPNNNDLRDDCIRIRLQIILSFNMLQGILGSQNQDNADHLNEELIEWIKNMGILHLEAIKILKPKTRSPTSVVDPSSLSSVLKYQNVSEIEIKDAIKKLS